MNLLFVAKREPQQRDLITRPYGRFHFLPSELARRGHSVHMLLISHKGTAATEVEVDGVSITTFNPRHDGPLRTLAAMRAQACARKPDWVIGCSDAWYGWLARSLAHRTGASLAVDAYDNYEAYMPWNLPLHYKWHRALRAAECVTAAGPQLASLLDRQRRGRGRTAIVPMAADPAFVPHDRYAARAELGLSLEAPLVGYIGSWAGNRGTDVLLAAFRLIRAQRPTAQLVLTGHPPAHAIAETGVVSLGYLPDAKLPLALSALDVACIITADTSFGRYSYPAKLCEAMACGIPVVATATDPVRWMLRNDSTCLAPVGDAQALAERTLAQMDADHTAYTDLPTWEDSARRFEASLLAAGKSKQ